MTEIDRLLAERLNALSKQNDELKAAEEVYLALEAERKPMLAMLTLKAEGKSHTEKEARAYASQEWRDFMAGLVAVEADYQFQKRRYEILDKAFFGALATFKRDAAEIPKGSNLT